MTTEVHGAVPLPIEAKAVAKPVTHAVFVDPSRSIVDLCKELGFVLLLDLKKLGEWPSGPFNHDNKDKPEANIDVTPYTVKVSDGSDTIGKTWEKAMKDASKDRKATTLHEGIALAKSNAEVLDKCRLALPGTSHGNYDIVQIEKKEDGKVVISPLFVGDTNTDHKTTEKEEGEHEKRLPFAVVFSLDKIPSIPNM